MTKSHCKPTTPIDQEEIFNINDPNFYFEAEFCNRLNRLQAIADLFLCAGESKIKELSQTGFFGLHNILHNTSEELRTICYKMLEWEGGAK